MADSEATEASPLATDGEFDTDLARLRTLGPAVWGFLVRAGRWVRKTVWRHERSDVTSLRVAADADTVRRVLGERYFEPGWETSYYYRGEVLNLRRVAYTDADRYPWRQVHVRGFEVDGGLELDPHRETEPLQHPEAHRREDPLSVEAGVEVVAGLLEEAGLDYEVVPADGGATPETGQD